MWIGNRTTIRQIKDDEWHELTKEGHTFVFKEVARNEQYIEMVDKKRGTNGLYLRLHADKTLIKSTRDADYRVLQKGSWEKAK